MIAIAILKQGILKGVSVSIKLPAGLSPTIKLSHKVRIRIIENQNNCLLYYHSEKNCEYIM